MNAPLQRTRTISNISNDHNQKGEAETPRVGGGNGFPPQNTSVGNKHPRFENIPEEAEPVPNKGKQEPLMLPIDYYLTIIGMLNKFKTKSTIWFDSQEAEKKRDSSRLVQFRLRGNKVTAIYEDETTRDVLATEIDVATRFASIFNATEAARLYELTNSGVPLHDAVLRVINETQDGENNDFADAQPLQRTMTCGGN